MPDLLWHTCFRWKLRPDQVTADTTYRTIENSIPIEDAGISAYMPLPDWDSRTPYFGTSLFTYDPTTDSYQCPDGRTLRRETAKYTEGKIVYRTDRGVCDACALKKISRTADPRHVRLRHQHRHARDCCQRSRRAGLPLTMPDRNRDADRRTCMAAGTRGAEPGRHPAQGRPHST